MTQDQKVKIYITVIASISAVITAIVGIYPALFEPSNPTSPPVKFESKNISNSSVIIGNENKVEKGSK